MKQTVTEPSFIKEEKSPLAQKYSEDFMEYTSCVRKKEFKGSFVEYLEFLIKYKKRTDILLEEAEVIDEDSEALAEIFLGLKHFYNKGDFALFKKLIVVLKKPEIFLSGIKLDN